MQNNQENIEKSQGAIQLVKPDDKIEISKNTFWTPKVFIPHLGYLSLYGQEYNTVNEIEDIPVIYISHDEIQTGIENQMLSELKNFFDVCLNLEASKTPNGMKCKLSINDGNLLELFGDVENTDDELDSNPLRRYQSTVFNWYFDNPEEKYRLYMPPDPKLLSKLEFSFFKDNTETQIDPKL